jgi:serine/threonine protein kinase
VYSDAQRKFILKLEDMTKNDEGSENEKIVLETLLNEPKDNLPRPLKFYRTDDNVNISVMVNNGVSLDGKTFKQFFKESPSSNDFLMAVKSLVNAVQNLHSMGFIHRDITPGNVVYNRKTNQWTLIDFDFTVPFTYSAMGSEVIVNPKYDYIIHPWFKLNEDDYMYFDVDRLKEYMHGTDVKWYMLIDYYAVSKVLLYTFGLLLSNNDTYPHVLKDERVMNCIIDANFTNSSAMLKKLLKILYEIVGSFNDHSNLPNATHSWDTLLILTGIKKNKKRLRNDSHTIKGSVGKLRRTNRGVRTYSLVK